MLRWLRRIVVGLLALVGAAAVALIAVVAFVGWSFVGSPTTATVPENAVLYLDLATPLADSAPEDRLLSLLSGGQMSLMQLENMLDRAGKDPRVKGLVVELSTSLPLSTVQAIRDDVGVFRKQGKFATIFAEDYDESGATASEYYLASAFEEIWLQPSGDVGLTGLVAETLFLRGTLDKLGIVAHFDKREEYKTAVNELTDTRYDPAFKESMSSLVSSLFDQLVKGIAEGRGINEDVVRGLIDQGPFLAADALKAKLVDRLGYRDEFEAAAYHRAGSGSRMISARNYLRATRPGASGGRVIATITASGPILSGKGGVGSPFVSAEARAGTIADAFRDASRASDVAAILFRIDSPGGSYTASDTIRRAVAEARKAGKPVIVSMGAVAASGGYFAALPANKIVAEPATLTGSIGVFAGKFVLTGLLDKLGISYDSVRQGANAGMWSTNGDFSPAAWRKLEALLDSIYGDFTSKVAESRGISLDHIPAVAKGRVWTGEDALRLGLVDTLGGFPTALWLARVSAGILPSEAVQLRPYPLPGSEYRELISDLFGVATSASAPETLATRLAAFLGASAAALRPLIAQLPALANGEDGYLLMPPIVVR